MVIKRIIIPVLILCLYLPGIFSHAQILRNAENMAMIKAGVDHIYNFEFDEARNVYDNLSKLYPEHPVTHMFRGLMTYWENYPLLPGSTGRQSFEDDLYACMEQSETSTGNQEEAEYEMLNLSARGMLLLFFADNEISMEVFSVASGTYKHVKRAFDFKTTYADFYFITGLYNYYREAYPEAHPIYKPIAFFFPKGDKETGLKELNIAARQAIFLKAEAYSFLSGIYISFENDFQQAFQYSKTLHELYPRNTQYLAVFIKNLLLIKRYDEAERIISESRKSYRNPYLMAQLNILQGIVLEKRYGNLSLAKTYYLSGLREAEPFGIYAGEYNAYAYFGLSRISAAGHDEKMAKDYRKLALDASDYENVNFDD